MVALVREEACHTRSPLRSPPLLLARTAALALLAALAACKPPPGKECSATPVVFVPGLEQRAAIFTPLIDSLARNGYPRSCLRALELVPRDGSNRVAAETQIAPAIEELLAEVNQQRQPADPPADRVHLVAHSMGALSARWYAVVLRPDRVASLITTSGANHGTNWNCNAPSGPGHVEMCPAFAQDERENSLQVRLNGGVNSSVDETPFGPGRDSERRSTVRPDARRTILYVTLRVARDPFITPNESLLLDGAGDPVLTVEPVAGVQQTTPGNFLLAATAGHDELLAEPAALELIPRLLNARNRQLSGR